MAEFFCCFWYCSRNSVCRMVLVTGLYPLWGADEVSGEVVIVKSLSYILLLMVPEQVWDWHFCSYWCVFFVFCLFFVSPCLVLSAASWGSVSLAVSSSSWEWRFLYSYERYWLWMELKIFCMVSLCNYVDISCYCVSGCRLILFSFVFLKLLALMWFDILFLYIVVCCISCIHHRT